MGYEDVLSNAEWFGEVVVEIICNLNTTEFYTDEMIIAHLIKGLLKQFSDDSREIVLNLVNKLLKEGR